MAIDWLPLLLKVLLTAGIVITVSLSAERLGPVVGGLVATLPVSAGPAYVFLAMQADSAFVAASALASFATGIAVVGFIVASARLAAHRSLLVTLAAALASWGTMVFVVLRVDWTAATALAANAATFALGFGLIRRVDLDRFAAPGGRPWYELPLRAGLVGFIVVVILLFGERIGPAATGIVAIFPVSLTSLLIVLHPRIGGRATAAIMGGALRGVLGFFAGMLTLHLVAGPFGSAAGLLAAFAVWLAWPAGVMAWRARAAG